jgi:hypothetical protein
MKRVASLRNGLIHKAADVAKDAAPIAIAVPGELPNLNVPKILRD